MSSVMFLYVDVPLLKNCLSWMIFVPLSKVIWLIGQTRF